MDAQSFFNDVVNRVNRLESHLFNGGKGIVYKVSKLENSIDGLSVVKPSLNDLENRLIILEERCERQRENIRLRQLIDFLNAFPFGWKGIVVGWIFCTLTITQVAELSSLSKIIANFLGLK